METDHTWTHTHNLLHLGKISPSIRVCVCGSVLRSNRWSDQCCICFAPALSEGAIKTHDSIYNFIYATMLTWGILFLFQHMQQMQLFNYNNNSLFHKGTAARHHILKPYYTDIERNIVFVRTRSAAHSSLAHVPVSCSYTGGSKNNKPKENMIKLENK